MENRVQFNIRMAKHHRERKVLSVLFTLAVIGLGIFILVQADGVWDYVIGGVQIALSSPLVLLAIDAHRNQRRLEIEAVTMRLEGKEDW